MGKGNVTIFVLGMIFGLLFFVLPTKCKQDTVFIEKTDTVKLKYEHTDTIERIRIKYRHLVDSHTRWVYDSTWGDVCRGYADSLQGADCQREVVRQLNQGQLDHELVDGYKDKWHKDSMWIETALTVDSIKTERIKTLVTKMAEKPHRNRKATVAHLLSAIGLAYFLIR
jgi:hypothetical protein